MKKDRDACRFFLDSSQRVSRLVFMTTQKATCNCFNSDCCDQELLEGLNLSESAKSQIVALGAYALSTEYIEQLRKDAIVNANCARSYADDYNQAQSDYYAHNATLFSSNASYGFRLADELERAAETPEVLKRLQENVAVSS